MRTTPPAAPNRQPTRRRDSREDLPPDYLTRLFPGEPLTVTLFEHSDLRQSVQRGRVWLASWPWLVRWTSSPGVAPAKDSDGGFTLADLRDGVRRNAHVERVSAVAFDHDAGAVQPAEASALFAPLRHIVFTTYNSTRQTPRWRAIVAISRPMTRREHRTVFDHMFGILSTRVVLDTCKDACRLWYAPTIPSIDADFQHVAVDGEPLDVDRALRAAGGA